MKKLLFAALLTLFFFPDCKKNDTTSSPQPLKACFAPSRTRIGPGDPVTFSNCSSGASSYLWDFGDGSQPVSSISPVYSYQYSATYSVLLTAYNADKTKSDTVSLYIIVDTAYYAPLAVISTQGFTFNTGQTVQCTGGQSEHAWYYSWDFGNGKTSAAINPTTSYTSPGTYTISLTVYSRDKTQNNRTQEAVTIK